MPYLKGEIGEHTEHPLSKPIHVPSTDSYIWSVRRVSLRGKFSERLDKLDPALTFKLEWVPLGILHTHHVKILQERRPRIGLIEPAP